MTSTTTRRTLADNLRRVIQYATPRGQRFSVRAWAMARGLDVRLIDRLLKGQHAVTLDKLQQIADAAGLQPWHLLYEGLDPGNLPDAPISAEDRATIDKIRRLLDT